MLPLNDTEHNRYSGLPIMTILLISINTILLFAKPFLGERLHLYMSFGSVPLQVFNQIGGGALSSLTSTFLHADVLHLLGNMIFLWVFGRRVEDACGPWRFLAFYLTCGLCSDLLSTVFRPGDNIPAIGASGAIFGVEGAYLLLYPGGRIRTFVPLWFVPLFPKIPAIWIALYDVVIQILPAIESLQHANEGGTNYWAHLGGFLGCILIILFLRPEAFARYISNEPV